MEGNQTVPSFTRRTALVGGLGYGLCWAVLPIARAGDAKRFEIVINDGKVPVDRRTIRVSEGDAVVIEFTSNRQLSLHLHGIEMETTVVPGKTALMSFDATVAGRFPVEAHGAGAHGSLVYVEVHPR